MTVDPSAERIHELRTERQSTEWMIEDLRAEGKEPSGLLFAYLGSIKEALLVELDARSERV